MLNGKVILVVDDEADLREILRDEFGFEGATVLEASNGVEALQIVKDKSVDVILSDIRMPGGDGRTLAREVRALHPFQPAIILITGFADLHAEEAFDIGADGYMTKPFHLEKLKKEVRKLSQGIRSEKSQGLKPEIATSKSVRLTESLSHLLKEQRAKLGRGGLYLQLPSQGFRLDEMIQLNFSDALSLDGTIRWIRSEAGEAGKEGFGFEFSALSEKVTDLFASIDPQWNQLKVYIPIG